MKSSRLVYSTGGANTCPRCSKILFKCKCIDNSERDDSENIVQILRETKGRKGAGVTLLKGIKGTDAELKNLAKEIKSICGAGGSIKARVIEIQGDQRETAKKFLDSKGIVYKLSNVKK